MNDYEMSESIQNKSMTFATYIYAAQRTAIYPRDNGKGLLYCALKLAGEAGEVSEKVGKAIRDGEFVPGDDYPVIDPPYRQALIDELGDVLWYVSQMAQELGVNLEGVAARNLEKLNDRAERGQIKGNGDKR